MTRQEITKDLFEEMEESEITVISQEVKEPKEKQKPEKNKAAKKAKLNVGCYYDTGNDFISSVIGHACAMHILKLMEGHVFEFPVYADIEVVATVHKEGATEAATTFCETLEKMVILLEYMLQIFQALKTD